MIMEKIPNGLYDPFYQVQLYVTKFSRHYIGGQHITVVVREYETETRWSVYVHNGNSEAVGTATQEVCIYTYRAIDAIEREFKTYSKSNKESFCEAYHNACEQLGIQPIEVED